MSAHDLLLFVLAQSVLLVAGDCDTRSYWDLSIVSRDSQIVLDGSRVSS